MRDRQTGKFKSNSARGDWERVGGWGEEGEWLGYHWEDGYGERCSGVCVGRREREVGEHVRVVEVGREEGKKKWVIKLSLMA